MNCSTKIKPFFPLVVLTFYLFLQFLSVWLLCVSLYSSLSLSCLGLCNSWMWLTISHFREVGMKTQEGPKVTQRRSGRGGFSWSLHILVHPCFQDADSFQTILGEEGSLFGHLPCNPKWKPERRAVTGEYDWKSCLCLSAPWGQGLGFRGPPFVLHDTQDKPWAAFGSWRCFVWLTEWFLFNFPCFQFSC